MVGTNKAKRNYRAELQHTINQTADLFFIDPEKRVIGGTTIQHWNVALAALTYATKQTMLTTGEPGTGKTTLVKTISSLFSGYPFDLYEAAQIQGHPDQTYETMIARLDFSKLKDVEEVIWLLSAYLSSKNIDEINRLPAGNQDELLNALETGRFSYLNSTFFKGKTPFFATANHPDDGNHVLIAPIRDRFAIHVELGDIGATWDEQLETAQSNLADLCKPEITDAIIRIINDKKQSIDEKLRQMNAARKDYAAFLADELQIRALEPEDLAAIEAEIKQVRVTDEAKIFRQMIKSELNSTPLYGRKRSNDPIDTSNHAKGLASTYVKNAGSYRAMHRGIDLYAKALAYLAGHSSVTKEHITAIAPHALGHRLEFTQDFVADHEGKCRSTPIMRFGMPREMYFAQKLVEGIEERYIGTKDAPGIKQLLDTLVLGFKTPERLSKEQYEQVKAMVDDPSKADHPLAREYAQRIHDECPDKFQ